MLNGNEASCSKYETAQSRMVHAAFTFKEIHIAMGNTGYTTIPTAVLKW